jgi:hypothetical protein
MKIQIGVVLAILVVSFGRMDTKASTLSDGSATRAADGLTSG